MNLLEYLKINTKKFIYIPNPGNAGDSLIALGAMTIFKKYNMPYYIGHHQKEYYNKTLLYAGGGNLVGIYKECEEFLLKNAKNNHVIILPHTIKDIDYLLQQPEIKNNVTFFCREPISYNYLKNFTHNIYIDHDLAFSISSNFLSKFKTKEPMHDIAYCFRIDKEKTNIAIPNNNKDISNIFTKINDHYYKITSDIGIISLVCNNIFEYISNYQEIHTNRLHVSIAASLLEKKCYLYPNSYYKNKAIYDFSIKNKFLNTSFIEQPQNVI